MHHTYLGPYRITEHYPKGALLKCPKTGDTISVHFQNLRKIELTEFMTLLPHNFDSEILQTMQMFRYNRNGSPEPPPNPDKNIYNDDYVEW